MTTPLDAADQLRACHALLQAGNLSRAEALARTLLAEQPNDAECLHLLGIIIGRQDRGAAALDLFTRALALAPGSPALLHDHAVALHRLGRGQQAIASLDRALALAPDYVEAWTSRGLILLHLGAAPAALASFDQALALRPDHHQAERGRGLALARQHDDAAALTSLSRVLAARPDDGEALIAAGGALHRLGRPEEALERLESARRHVPGSAEACYASAGVLVTLDRLEDAIAACDAALERQSNLPEALILQGTILNRLRRYGEAIASFDAALALPDAGDLRRAEAHFFRGRAFTQMERPHEALACFDQAIALQPDSSDAWAHRGTALRMLGEIDDAFTSYDTALRIDPHNQDAQNMRVVALTLVGRHAEAEAAARAVLALNPDNGATHNNLADALRRMHRLPEAMAHFRTAIALSSEADWVRVNYAMCLLIAGRLREGWQEYEARWNTDMRPAAPEEFHRPQWRGAGDVAGSGAGDVAGSGAEDIAGKRLFLYSEQGYGDTIQFARYVPMVIARGASVVLSVQPALRDLFTSLDPTVTVIDVRNPGLGFDLHCPLMSLPYAFGTELDSIPARIPYLAPSPAHRAQWRSRLGPRRFPRVGFVWSGNPDYKEDFGRSLTLELLEPLLALLPEAFCLQRDFRPVDVPTLARHPGLHFFGRDLRDFSDTAALIEQLDLVISMDSSVLHLAGALGRPVWGMIRHESDWRWMLGHETSAWYPSLRLFHQPAPGDWPGMIARMRDELARFITAGETAGPDS